MSQSYDNPEYRYCLLRTALEQAGKPPADLAEAERGRAEALARRAFALEERVLAAPEALEVVIPDSALEASYHSVAERYPDGEALAAALAASGLDADGLRLALRRQLRVEAVLERVGAAAGEASEADAELFYHLHHERFLRQETRTVRHILITVNDDFAENRRQAARSRAEALAERLAGAPEAFGGEALKNSECPSAMHEGLVGTVPRGQLYAELDEVLFAMEEGTVSGVVESELGFHVLYCEAVRPAGPVPLAEALPKILEQLNRRRREAAQREWLGRLKG